MTELLQLLRSTRWLTATAVLLLAVQLFGNLYEQLVPNVGLIADPRPSSVVGELEPGSPVFYYLPWAPLGVALVVVLAIRLQRRGPNWVTRRMWSAVACLAVAVLAKVVLITQVNPLFRDTTAAVETVRTYAIGWAVGNGITILAVAAALLLLTTWRAHVLDRAVAEGADAAPTGNLAVPATSAVAPR